VSIDQADFTGGGLTTTSTTYESIGSGATGPLKLTPGAGTYLAVYSCTCWTDDTSAGENVYFALFENGVEQTHTTRRALHESSMTGESGRFVVVGHAKLTVAAAQEIEVKWKTVTGQTGYIDERSLTLVPIGSLGSEATGTGDVNIVDNTFVVIDDAGSGPMKITPGAGTYLVLFSCTHESGDTAETGSPHIIFRLYVNGSHTGYEHTERIAHHEGSFQSTDLITMICAKVTVSDSQQIDIRWAQSFDSAYTVTCHERTLNLVKFTDTTQIDQVSVNDSDDADTSTSFEIVDGMNIGDTNLGAGDYCAFFSSYWLTSNISATRQIDTTFYEGASQDTPSERRGYTIGTSHQTTSEMPFQTTGKLTLGATDDAQVYWKSDDTTSRTAKDRTLVLIEEPSTAAYDQEGYRWRDDDGSESGASWLIGQDLNITRAKNTNTRLRVIVDITTGDPGSEQYQLEFREKGSGDPWKKIDV
jgi:hypothetical protein